MAKMLSQVGLLFLVGVLSACAGDASVTPASDATNSVDGGVGLTDVGIGGDDPTLPMVPVVVPTGGTTASLSVTSPARGATLDGDPSITVSGKVTGKVVSSLTVNGAPVTPSADGTFSHVLQATHGMNLLVVESKDEAVTEKLVQSFYYSKKWLAADVMINAAVVGWLGQPIFDDGANSTTDFASIVETSLASLDVASLVPKSQRIKDVAGCDHADIDIKNFRFDPATVSLDVKAGALVAKVTITGIKADVDADMSGPWYNPACAVGVSGDVKASSVVVTASFGATVQDGQLQAKATQTSAKINGFDIDISGVWGFLTNWLVNTFEDDLKSDLEKTIKGELDDQLNSLLSKGLADLAFNETLECPALLGVGAPATIDLTSRLSTLAFEQGGVKYSMEGSTTAQPVSEHLSALGSIGYDQCGAGDKPFVFQNTADHPLQLAVSDDLINRLLHSVHHGGVLQATLTQQSLAELLGGVGITDFEGTLDALLPPIYNSCTPDGEPVLQLGDLRLKAKFNLLGQPVEMQVHVSTEVPVNIEVIQAAEGQRVHLSLEESSLIEIESKDLSNGKSTVYDAVKMLLRKQVIPSLLETLQETAISIPIPEMDLAKMHSSVPAGTKVRLNLADVEQRDGHAVVVGTIK